MRPEACAIAEQQQWLTRLRIEKWPEKIVGTRAVEQIGNSLIRSMVKKP